MATTSKQLAKTTTAPASASPSVKAGFAVQDMNYAAEIAADAGKGLVNVDADSIAIPFLAVLQTNSPQVDPDSGEYIPGAKAGMLFNTVTKETFDGKTGVQIVPCEYQRKFLRWSPREQGGGFKGEYKAEEVVRMREAGELIEQDNRLFVPDDAGNVNPKKNDKVADTRVHYVMVLNPRSGAAQQAVLSLGSTQIKKSKQLISLLGNVVITHPQTGAKATPPTFANVVRLTTIPESNDKGKWTGVKFELEGFVPDPDVYRAARAFNKLVNAGRTAVNYEAGAPTDEQDEDRATTATAAGRRF